MRVFPALVVTTLFAAGAAWAGPPYVTDDPAPTEPGRWEIYGYVGGARGAGETAGEGGLDFNYGAAKDLQLTFVVPAVYSRSGGSTAAGLGVVELAAKLKVLHQAEGSAMPDLAIFPRLFVPTADSRFAPDRLGLLLPVWAGKDFGPWSLFGGGGYQVNPGPGSRDFWTGGVALSRALGERWSLGAEVYHHGPDADDGLPFTGLNLGVTYKVTDHWSLLAAGGPGVQNAREEGRYAFYLALKADY